MRDARSLLLLLVSLLLILVSFGLLWTWGYRFYNKNDEILREPPKVIVVDSNALVNRVRDSLQKVYASTLQSLDDQLETTLNNTDSLKTQLDIKLDAFYRLSNEIAVLLKNRDLNANVNVAQRKIGELQSKADDIKVKNQIVEKENNKLNSLLSDLKKPEKARGDNSIKTGLNASQPVIEKQAPPQKNDPTFAVFNTADLKLAAVMVDKDEQDVETFFAAQAEKLVGSFNVVNNISQLSNAEVLVVIIQPDGRNLRTSGWESGTFNTPEGKKIYSYKFNFKYTKGVAKRLTFTLRSANKYQQGNYNMEVYYNGELIGRLVKSLS